MPHTTSIILAKMSTRSMGRSKLCHLVSLKEDAPAEKARMHAWGVVVEAGLTEVSSWLSRTLEQ